MSAEIPHPIIEAIHQYSFDQIQDPIAAREALVRNEQTIRDAVAEQNFWQKDLEEYRERRAGGEVMMLTPSPVPLDEKIAQAQENAQRAAWEAENAVDFHNKLVGHRREVNWGGD